MGGATCAIFIKCQCVQYGEVPPTLSPLSLFHCPNSRGNVRNVAGSFCCELVLFEQQQTRMQFGTMPRGVR
jgi:hypothetical protein